MLTLPGVSQRLLQNMKIKGYSGNVDITGAFLFTGKTGENFAPDGTVQFFFGKK